MENNNTSKASVFYAVVVYKKADAEIRGKFSLDGVAKTRLLEQAKNEGIESLIVTSTCNRTEIYGLFCIHFN
jgi:glutamyl-tRNA reductase